MEQHVAWHKVWVKRIAGLALAFFLLYRAVVFYLKAFHGFAWDYSVNWTAAVAWREGVSLYDLAALHQLALSTIGDGARALFNGRFTAYVGLPSTAFFHLPFSFLSYDSSVMIYRIAATVAMMLTIYITGLSLPAALRWRAWITGALCLLCWHAFAFSVSLGQVDAWVMLSLALTIFFISRSAWKRAGAALAVAVLLKISPVWLLLYCVLQRQWALVLSASACLLLGLLLCWLPQHGADLQQFVTVVLPSLGDSPLHVQNQSLGAFFARLVSLSPNLLRFDVGIGMWKMAAASVAAVLLLCAWRTTRQRDIAVDKAALMIVVALLAGPLTWDHYLSWAVIPVMLFAATLRLRQWLLLFLLLLPLVFPVPYIKADAVAEYAGWRILTSTQILALLLLAVWMACSSGIREKWQK